MDIIYELLYGLLFGAICSFLAIAAIQYVLRSKMPIWVIIAIKLKRLNFLKLHTRKISRVELVESLLSAIIIIAYVWNSLYRPDLRPAHYVNFFLPDLFRIRTSGFYTPPMTLIIIGLVGLVVWYITKDFVLSVLLIGFGSSFWEIMANEFADYYIWRIISNPIAIEWMKYWLEFSLLFLLMLWIRVDRVKPNINRKILLVSGILYFGLYFMWIVAPNYTIQGYFYRRTGATGYYFTDLMKMVQRFSGYYEKVFGYLFWSLFSLIVVKEVFSGKVFKKPYYTIRNYFRSLKKNGIEYC